MNKLKTRREQCKLSQSQLARKSGVNNRNIQGYEQGSRDINKAQCQTVYRLAKALDCTVEDILEVEKI